MRHTSRPLCIVKENKIDFSKSNGNKFSNKAVQEIDFIDHCWEIFVNSFNLVNLVCRQCYQLS